MPQVSLLGTFQKKIQYLIYIFILCIDETGLGQQWEENAQHLDNIREGSDSLRKEIDSLAIKMRSSLAEPFTAIKHMTNGREAGDLALFVIIEALENLHLSPE